MHEYKHLDGSGRGNSTAGAFHVLTPYLAGAARRISVLAVAAVLAGYASQAKAQTADEMYSGCTFDPEALSGLMLNDTANPFSSSIDGDTYIVIYNRKNPNSGFPLAAGGYTGPILCAAIGQTVEPDMEDVAIPDNNRLPNSVSSVDILDNPASQILKYDLNENPDTGFDGLIENRFCQATGGGVDCVVIHE